MPGRFSPLRVLVLATAALAPGAVGAQSVPERFVGVWKEALDVGNGCAAADWDVPGRADSYLRIGPREVHAHESLCRVVSIATQGPSNPFAAIKVRVDCDVEGTRATRTEVWQVSELRRRRVLQITGASSPTSHIALYEHCPGTPSMAPASGAGRAPPAPPIARPVEQAEEYRNLPLVIRQGVEEVRARCREMQAENTTDMQGIQFIRLGTGPASLPAILVDHRELCAGHQPGGNCSNRGCDLTIWTMRRDGSWAASFSEHAHSRALHIDGGSKRLVSMEVRIHAERPQCQPPRGAFYTSGQSCRVSARYEGGRWNWRLLERPPR